MRQEGTKALAGGAGETDRDRILRQTRMTMLHGYFAREHGTDRAIDVADRHLDPHRLALGERGLSGGDQLVVERLVETVLLALAVPDLDAGLGRHLVEDLRQVDATRLPMIDRLLHVEAIDPADHLAERPEAQ